MNLYVWSRRDHSLRRFLAVLLIAANLSSPSLALAQESPPVSDPAPIVSEPAPEVSAAAETAGSTDTPAPTDTPPVIIETPVEIPTPETPAPAALEIADPELPASGETITLDEAEPTVASEGSLTPTEEIVADLKDIETPPIALMSFGSDGTPTAPAPNILSAQTSLPRVDNFSGALTQRIKLDIPPGRNGLQPDLALEYNSQNTEDGIVGYGWRVSIPYIQRLNKTGSQAIYNIPTFTSSLEGELATTSASTTLFRARVDDGSFNSYNFSDNSWAVYDKKGTRYLYGATSQAQQSATTSSSLVYRWMLEEIRDTNNNYVKFTYTKDGNQIYPSQVIYTGNGTTDGPLTVDFTTASRPDPIVDYRPGFRTVTYNRISQITAKVSGTMVRQYALGYTTGHNGKRSLLNSIQLTGRDDLGNQASLPAMTFSYVNSNTQFVGPGPHTTIFSSSWIPADANGDGTNDTTVIWKDTSSNTGLLWSIYNPAGGTLSSMPEYWASGGAIGDSHPPAEVGVRYLDMNADGKADIVRSAATSTIYLNTYSTSTAYAWTATTTFRGIIPDFNSGNFTTGLLGDVNGDGLADFEQYLSGGPGPVSWLANGSAWNTATSTIFTPVYSLPSMSTGPTVTNSQLIDMNGDGLSDWVFSTNTDTRTILNTGSGFETQPDPRWDIATTTLFKSNTSYHDRGIRFLDINGDNLPDFIRSYNMPWYSNSSGDPPEIVTTYLVMLNTGSGWATSTAYNISGLTPITFGSVTGGSSIWDGVLRHSEFANWMGNGQQKQDVISTITYPTGGSTDIAYATTSSMIENIELPYTLLVVTSITNHDGFGSNEQTTYTYNGGKQYLPAYIQDRKFAGFASSTESTANRITATYFNQGNYVSPYLGEQSDGYGQINRPFRTEVRTTAGTLVQKTLNRWDTYAHGNSQFVGLGRQMIMDYSSDGTHRERATDYTYSSTTNDLLQLTQYGEVTGSDTGTFTDTGSDKRTTVITYATTTAVNNLSLPYKKVVLNNSSATSTESRYYYDGQALGTITLGNNTKAEDWITSTTWASSTVTFNSNGLPSQKTDRQGNRTYFSYDANNLYVSSSTDALSRTSFFTYDYATGRVKQSTDPNGRIIKTVFDPFGRTKQIEQSDLVTPATTVVKSTIQYTDNSTPPSSIRRTDYFTSTTTNDVYSYLDGLSRSIQDRRTSDLSASTTVTDRTYDTTGALASVSLPYFNSGTSRTTATTTSALFTTYVYDPLQRVTTLTNAAGTTNTSYAKWTTSVTDPNGNIKDYIRDAFGNLVQVIERAATDYTTNYTYDAADNLTQITDALSNIRTFTYDGLGRRLTAQDLHASADATFGSWSYTYDHQGNLTSSTNPNSNVVNRTYDKLNRMLTENYTGAAGTEVTNTYDSCTYGLGQLCIASSTAAKITNSYDVLGRLASTTNAILGIPYSLIYTYDIQGNMTSVKYPSGTTVKYGYNTAGQTNGVSRTASAGSVSSMITNMSYAPQSLPTMTQFGNGTTTDNFYDANKLYRMTRKVTH